MTAARGGRSRASAASAVRQGKAVAAAPPALPRMSRPAYAVALCVAALCALAAVTYAIYDTDIWQHLLVGKVIWQTHAIPSTQLWTWPTHGAPDVLPSWLFRALLWPFWWLGGVHGLFAWRWLTTLAAFGLMLVAARRMGATGVAPLVMLVWCVLFWRQRSQVRPETFAGILLAAEVLLLETRRQLAGRSRAIAGSGARDGAHAMSHDLAWGLVPIALLWANAHISYYLGFILSGGYLLDELLHRGRGGRPGVLALAMVAAALASLANPFGLRALLQPLDYFTVWRHEPVYQTIGELAPIYWDVHVRDGLIAWLVLVVGAAFLRWRRHGFDAAECVLLLVCLPQALTTQRFLGYAALTLAPFAARDVGTLVSRWAWPAALRAPARRGLLASVLCVALVTPSLLDPTTGLSYGWRHHPYPERACDWVESHGVRGRAFNAFSFGGYMLWRFYPDPGRLPFMDIHQAGTKEIRYLYAWSLQDSTAWRELDRRYRFDYLLLQRPLAGKLDVADFLDADSTWALVFADDAAALWLRRDGSCGALARSFAYRFLPGGTRAVGALGELAASDSASRAPMRAEFERAIAASPWNTRARALAGNLALSDGRFEDARTQFGEAVREEPFQFGLHERLGLAEIYAGDPRAALAAFRTERELRPAWPEADLRTGQALAALGDRKGAREAYERSLARHPEISEARDSLAALPGSARH